MTMDLPRPSTCGTRPAHLDNLFRDSPSRPSSGLHSANSSISFGSTPASDYRSIHPAYRPLLPAFEDDCEDRGSVGSFRLNLSPRFDVKKLFNRRTYPQARETVHQSTASKPVPSQIHPALRRPSLPRLQTSFSAQLRKDSVQMDKPLPVLPVQTAQEVACHRCYYFAARNCKGWVMGGTHGDACEQCLQAGYFGAP